MEILDSHLGESSENQSLWPCANSEPVMGLRVLLSNTGILIAVLPTVAVVENLKRKLSESHNDKAFC